MSTVDTIDIVDTVDTVDTESHSVIARCMGKTCGSAVCGGGDSCHSSRTAWRNPFSETTVKQSEK